MLITANIQFRPAQKEDLLKNSKQLRLGQAYLLKNGDGKSLSGFHIIDTSTDPLELSAWFKDGKVFVPVSSLDSKIIIDK